MNVIEAIILGIIQGLSEFIPISSSGHLILAEKFFGLGVGSLLFDVMLHTGTLLALLIYFWHDVISITRQVWTKKGSKLWLYLAVGTIPAALAGYFLETLAANSFRNVWLVIFNLTWVALLMIWVEKITKTRTLEQIKAPDAFMIGTAQALALIPGVSRSGITITAGMGLGFGREVAARFSFLLAIPITLGAVVKLLMGSGISQVGDQVPVFVAGVVTSAIFGYLAIRFLLNYLSRHHLHVFAYYRLAVACVLAAGLVFGWL